MTKNISTSFNNSLRTGFNFFVVLVLGLVKSGQRADQDEKKLLSILTQENDKTQKGNGVENTFTTHPAKI